MNLVIGIPTVKRTRSNEEYDGKAALVLKAAEEGKRSKIGFTPQLCADLNLDPTGVEVNIAVATEEGTNIPKNIYFIPTPGLAVSNKNGLQLRTFSNKSVYDYLVQHILKSETAPTEDIVLEVEISKEVSIAPWAIKVLPMTTTAVHPFDDAEVGNTVDPQHEAQSSEPVAEEWGMDDAPVTAKAEAAPVGEDLKATPDWANVDPSIPVEGEPDAEEQFETDPEFIN